ncbi:MAG: hypothetical protein KKB74_03700, partial [Bacteroidetes bacterium]|nr:hypothetical protein [Bacteroidota bacterium]
SVYLPCTFEFETIFNQYRNRTLVMKKQPLIDLKNYEIFVIDYLDGQLSKAEETALLAFLDQHPDLKDDFEGLELATLEPITIEADFKQELKKNTCHKGCRH